MAGVVKAGMASLLSVEAPQGATEFSSSGLFLSIKFKAFRRPYKTSVQPIVSLKIQSSIFGNRPILC